MPYVDGFIVPVRKDSIEEYKALARKAGAIWKEYGALAFVECLADDVPYGKLTSFPRAVELKEDEANVVAELLGAPQLMVRLAALQARADSVITEQLPMPPSSPFAGRPLGDTNARTRTGVSIVAVLRHGVTHPSPGPDFVLHGGDLVVSVGTREGLDQLARRLDGAG